MSIAQVEGSGTGDVLRLPEFVLTSQIAVIGAPRPPLSSCGKILHLDLAEVEAHRIDRDVAAEQPLTL